MMDMSKLIKVGNSYYTAVIHKGLNKIKFLRRVQLCQGNLDWCQRKVSEMSGNFLLPINPAIGTNGLTLVVLNPIFFVENIIGSDQLASPKTI